jgi:hypothetical protein
LIGTVRSAVERPTIVQRARGGRGAEAHEVGPQRREPRARRGVVAQEREIGEVEAGADGRADVREVAERLGRLPPARLDDVSRRDAARVERAERRRVHGVERRWHQPEAQRAAFEQMPHLVGADPMPCRALAAREEEIDRRQGTAVDAAVARTDRCRRAEHLAVMAAFGMRRELQEGDERLGTCVHGGNILSPDRRRARTMADGRHVHHHRLPRRRRRRGRPRLRRRARRPRTPTRT